MVVRLVCFFCGVFCGAVLVVVSQKMWMNVCVSQQNRVALKLMVFVWSCFCWWCRGVCVVFFCGVVGDMKLVVFMSKTSSLPQLYAPNTLQVTRGFPGSAEESASNTSKMTKCSVGNVTSLGSIVFSVGHVRSDERVAREGAGIHGRYPQALLPRLFLLQEEIHITITSLQGEAPTAYLFNKDFSRHEGGPGW